MTELYVNTGIWKRTIAYAAVIVVAMLWGGFELWQGAHAEGGDAQSSGLFGTLFIGGGIYAIWQLINDWRDVITSLARDETGALVATVWSPTGPGTVRGSFSDWRYHVTIAGRRTEVPWILVDVSGAPRPLRIDLRQKADMTGLSTVAPEAVDEYRSRNPAAASKPR